MVLLLASPASASVRLSIAPGPLPPSALKETRAAAARLMVAPQPAVSAGAVLFTAPSWKTQIPPVERARQLEALKSIWGTRFSVHEDAPAAAASSAVVPPPSAKQRARLQEMKARLAGASHPLNASSQNVFYDGSLAGKEAAVSAVAAGGASARKPVLTATAPKHKAAPPPAPTTAKPATKPISWKRAGLEMLKGAGHTIAEVFTWKGLAVAAGSIALVTVAPVAIYGLLVLGAAFSGWTIGKALYNGTAAYKAGDAEAFYGASREMGRGLLALGMTMMGARHTPTNLRPHFPNTGGEWRAMAAACDDEPIVAMSILRGRTEKP